MKKIQKDVLLACALCAACFVLGGLLRLGAKELIWVSQLLAVLGVFAVAQETFRWGASNGYVIGNQTLGVQVEHGLRCLVMAGIMVLVSGVCGGLILQVLYQLFWR